MVETCHSSRLQDFKVSLKRYNTQLDVSTQLRDKLELTMLVKRWRDSVSTRIIGQFHILMSQRGVKGSMKIDHKKGELILMVNS